MINKQKTLFFALCFTMFFVLSQLNLLKAQGLIQYYTDNSPELLKKNKVKSFKVVLNIEGKSDRNIKDLKVGKQDFDEAGNVIYEYHYFMLGSDVLDWTLTRTFDYDSMQRLIEENRRTIVLDTPRNGEAIFKNSESKFIFNYKEAKCIANYVMIDKKLQLNAEYTYDDKGRKNSRISYHYSYAESIVDGKVDTLVSIYKDTTTYLYDRRGYCVEEKTKWSDKIIFKYNKKGLLRKKFSYSSTRNSLRNKTIFYYNYKNQLVEIAFYTRSSIKEKIHIVYRVYYEYYLNGLIKSYSEIDDKKQMKSLFTFTYEYWDK